MVGWLKFVKTFFDDDHFEESCQHKKKNCSLQCFALRFRSHASPKIQFTKAYKQAFAIC